MAMRLSCWTCQPRSGWVLQAQPDAAPEQAERIVVGPQPTGQQVAFADDHAIARFQLAEQRDVALLDQDVVARRAGHETIDGFAKQPAAFEVGRVAGRDDRCGAGGIGRVAERHAGCLRDEPAVHGRRFRGHAQRQFLAQHARQEYRVAEDVAPPQAARFDDQPEHPFQAKPAHPGGRTRHRPAQEIEQRTDRHRQGAMARRDVLGDPEFLARHAHGDQQYVGPQRFDPLEDQRLLLRREVAVMDHHDPVMRRHLGELGRCSLGVGTLGAEQRDRQRPRLGRQKRRNEIGAVEVCRERLAVEQLRRHIDADAVGEDEEIRQRLGKLRIGAGKIGVVRVEEADLGEAAFGDEAAQQADRCVEADAGDRDPQNILPGRDAGQLAAGMHVHADALSRLKAERPQAERQLTVERQQAGRGGSGRRRRRSHSSPRARARAANSTGSSATTQFERHGADAPQRTRRRDRGQAELERLDGLQLHAASRRG